jgi:hypothetical protein
MVGMMKRYSETQRRALVRDFRRNEVSLEAFCARGYPILPGAIAFFSNPSVKLTKYGVDSKRSGLPLLRAVTNGRHGAMHTEVPQLLKRCLVKAAVLGCLSASATGDPGASLPEGAGLAAGYPGDRGISAAPGVIYATDFEQGIEAPMQARRGGVSITSEPGMARSGKSAARIVATRGKDNGGDLLIEWQPGLERVFVRVYARFDKNAVMPSHFINVGGHTRTYRHRLGGAAGLLPPGDENGSFRTTLEPPTDPGGSWKFYTYWHEMRSWQTPEGKPDGRPNAYYGNNFPSLKPTPPLQRDAWICLEYMIQLNTPGEHDGEMAFWIDGVNYGHWKPGQPAGRWLRETFHTRGRYFDNHRDPKPFEGFNWRTHESLKINRAMLQWYHGSSYRGSEVDEHIVYFDNLVIASSYIGPLAGPAGADGL